MIEFRTRNLDFARESLTDTLLLESFPLPITASSSLAKVSLIALFFSLIEWLLGIIKQLNKGCILFILRIICLSISGTSENF